MKKSILFLACASLLGGSAVAQDVTTLFTQGKDAIAKYDKLNSEYMIAKAKDNNAADPTAVERAGYLMEGIKLLNQALPLDTIIEVDKKTGETKIDKKTGKPKFKVKYSKEIQDLLVSHINDIVVVGNSYLQANNYENSFIAYGAFLEALKNPLAKERGVALEQESVAEILFFQAYSAYQIQRYQEAYEIFGQAIELGYTQNNVEEYKNSCVANIVQGFCDANNYDAANAYVDGLISTQPTGFLYNLKGFIIEAKDGLLKAEEAYKKAMELGNGDGYIGYGRFLCEKVTQIQNDNPNATDKELASKIVPLYKEAIEVLKTAKGLATDRAGQIDSVIENIEYRLEMFGAK